MSVSPSLSILSVLVARVSNKSITVPITLRESQKNREPIELEALLDSGAGGLFIDTMMRLTVPWKGKLTNSNQLVTVEVLCCETGPVSEVTA